MGKPGITPVKMSRSVCVIEVTRDRMDPPTYVQCLISIAGRPSTFSRTWPTGGKPVNDDNIKDLLSWVLLNVENAVCLSVGVQGQLGEDRP